MPMNGTGGCSMRVKRGGAATRNKEEIQLLALCFYCAFLSGESRPKVVPNSHDWKSHGARHHSGKETGEKGEKVVQKGSLVGEL